MQLSVRSREAMTNWLLMIANGFDPHYVSQIACTERPGASASETLVLLPLRESAMSEISLENQLLRRLTPSERSQFGPLEPVTLTTHDPIEAANAPIAYVHFIETGFV